MKHPDGLFIHNLFEKTFTKFILVNELVTPVKSGMYVIYIEMTI